MKMLQLQKGEARAAQLKSWMSLGFLIFRLIVGPLSSLLVHLHPFVYQRQLAYGAAPNASRTWCQLGGVFFLHLYQLMQPLMT